ncbi:MAG: Crp/Fnr family transcriptional regulator [Saprospiraceae bacterium]|nr:Crp/Fnr family transcriptional regulator [Lewinella sp.]
MDSQSLIGRMKALFPVFSQFDLITEIVNKGQWMELTSGEQIMDVGIVIRAVPLVVTGTIKVIREDEDGNEILLYYIKAGESCAMTLSSCLRNEKSAVRAVVERPAGILALPVSAVYDFVLRFPSWNDFITVTYAQRFEEMIELIDHISFYKMDVRLLKYLIDKSHLFQSRTLTVSRTQIAKDLNSSREVISRLLKHMEKKKLIRMDGSTVELLEE